MWLRSEPELARHAHDLVKSLHAARHVFASFDQPQQRRVVWRRYTESLSFAHDRAVDRVDLGGSTALDVLQHGWLRIRHIATVAQHALGRAGVRESYPGRRGYRGRLLGN